MTRIVAPVAVQASLDLCAGLLERVSPNDSEYAAIWSRHYTRSRGAIGRQTHYLVRLGGRVVGIVAAGEPMFRNRARDRALGLVYAHDKEPPPRWLASCVAFRVEGAPHGFASACLAEFRAGAASDWKREYGDEIMAWETTVEPPRYGACFRKDGWRRVGRTTGRGARRPAGHGHGRKRVFVATTRKIVLVRDGRAATKAAA